MPGIAGGLWVKNRKLGSWTALFWVLFGLAGPFWVWLSKKCVTI